MRITAAVYEALRPILNEMSQRIDNGLDLIRDDLMKANPNMTEEMYKALRPILNEMREDISSMKSDVVTIKATISNHTEEVDARFNEIVNNLMHKVEQHNNESESQLAAVCDLTTSTVASLENELSSMRDDFSGVERELSSLNSTANMICDKIEEHDNHVTTELMRMKQTLTEEISGGLKCGGTWGWRRAVYLDMTDPNTNCPSGWQLTGYSKRTCGRASSSSRSCDSVFFPVSGGPYSQVCGRIRAYQYGWPDAFLGYNDGGQTRIDSAYVSGVAVMYGSPRQHIWTFANGGWENGTTTSHSSTCPCDISGENNNMIPPFVGEDYFCESGYVYPGYNSYALVYTFHSNDTLWDGRDCHSTSTCCALHNPPYFTKTLNQTTTDDLELRMCLFNSASSDNIAVELVELYVK